MREYRLLEPTAGPFDKFRAGSSTEPLAVKLREASLRMTISI
jgi:hypothetical protein